MILPACNQTSSLTAHEPASCSVTPLLLRAAGSQGLCKHWARIFTEEEGRQQSWRHTRSVVRAYSPTAPVAPLVAFPSASLTSVIG